MFFHQSKGLEFPFVIVDVGSRFNKNKIKTSFLRFPKEGAKLANLEDKIRLFTPLGADTRDSKDRAFDDADYIFCIFKSSKCFNIIWVEFGYRWVYY